MTTATDLTNVYTASSGNARPRLRFRIRRRVWLTLTIACLAVDAAALYGGYLIVHAAA